MTTDRVAIAAAAEANYRARGEQLLDEGVTMAFSGFTHWADECFASESIAFSAADAERDSVDHPEIVRARERA